MSKDTGGPAFPIEGTATPYAHGMTLRDWFATKAPPIPHWWMEKEERSLQPPKWQEGMLASDWDRLWNEFYMHRLASWAFHYADAMIAERVTNEHE